MMQRSLKEGSRKTFQHFINKNGISEWKMSLKVDNQERGWVPAGGYQKWFIISILILKKGISQGGGVGWGSGKVDKVFCNIKTLFEGIFGLFRFILGSIQFLDVLWNVIINCLDNEAKVESPKKRKVATEKSLPQVRV